MELIVPESYHESFHVVQSSAEGDFDCAVQYPCGDVGNPTHQSADSINAIDVNKGKTDGQKATSPGTSNATNPFTAEVPPPTTPETTPAPSVFGKFKRSIFEK